MSFWCSLDNFLLKNVITFFLEIKFQNGAHLKKRTIFDLIFTFFSHQGKDTTIPSAHISHTYTYFALTILQKLQIYHVWFLFGVTPSVDSFSRHFGAINK